MRFKADPEFVCSDRIVQDNQDNSGAIVLLVILSQLLAAYNLSSDMVMTENIIESAIPQAALDMCQRLASNFR